MSSVELGCRCGQIQGHLTMPAVKTNHVVCYCKDCQAFAHWLSDQECLNSASGTHIVQVPPSAFHISQGQQQLACMRLSAKGLYRWYSRCCHTPIANTVGAGFPMVGIIHAFIRSGQDSLPPPMPVNVSNATAPVAANEQSGGLIVLRDLSRILWWKATGKNQPNTLFRQGKAVVEPQMASQAPASHEAAKPMSSLPVGSWS